MIELHDDGLVYCDGKPCKALAKMELRLMRLFVSKPGVLIGYDEAMRFVWGDTNRDKDAAHELIYRVRKKIDPEIRYLRARSGSGFVFYPNGNGL